MYCRNCGKEISDKAFMCPDCGEPTHRTETTIEAIPAEPLSTGARNVKGLTVVGFILAVFAFVTGIVFGAFFYVLSAAQLLLLVLDGTTILPALAGLSLCAYGLILKPDRSDKVSKPLAIVGIVLAGVVLLFLFISGCVIVTM